MRSGWISTGIIDRESALDGRYYAVSYDIGYSNGSNMQVFWVNEGGTSWTVARTSNTPTGYRTTYFRLWDFMGPRGYFSVKVAGGGRVYSIADNIARQQLSEPFTRKVGQGIDTSSGSMTFADQDISIPGPLPLVFARYFNAHSDRLGPLGYRWSHSYDTHLAFGQDGDVGDLRIGP